MSRSQCRVTHHLSLPVQRHRSGILRGPRSLACIHPSCPSGWSESLPTLRARAGSGTRRQGQGRVAEAGGRPESAVYRWPAGSRLSCQRRCV